MGKPENYIPNNISDVLISRGKVRILNVEQMRHLSQLISGATIFEQDNKGFKQFIGLAKFDLTGGLALVRGLISPFGRRMSGRIDYRVDAIEAGFSQTINFGVGRVADINLPDLDTITTAFETSVGKLDDVRDIKTATDQWSSVFEPMSELLECRRQGRIPAYVSANSNADNALVQVINTSTCTGMGKRTFDIVVRKLWPELSNLGLSIGSDGSFFERELEPGRGRKDRRPQVVWAV